MLHNTSVRQDLGYCTLFAPSQHQWWNVMWLRCSMRRGGGGKRPSSRCQTHWGWWGMVTGYPPRQLTTQSGGSVVSSTKLPQWGPGAEPWLTTFWAWKSPFGYNKWAIFDDSVTHIIAIKSRISLIPCGMAGIHPESGRIPPKAGRLACLHGGQIHCNGCMGYECTTKIKSQGTSDCTQDALQPPD